MINDGLFSSSTSEWETPKSFFDSLDAEFGPFDLDPCATSSNHKCPVFFTKEDNGLNLPWTGRVFMNPPYGREVYLWVEKAYEESQKGATVVCLLPARTDTQWFHDYCTRGEIRFVKGRLKFGGQANSAPFPSMVVVFYPPSQNVIEFRDERGYNIKYTI